MVKARVESELDTLSKWLASLRAVPDQVNDENSVKLRKLDDQFKDSVRRAEEIEKNWDELNNAPLGSNVENLEELAHSTNLPQQAKDAIESYLGKLPPYLLGKGPAPREQLDFLNRQLEMVGHAQEIKSREYTAAIRHDLSNQLGKGLSGDLLTAQASFVHLALLKDFGGRTLLWARTAVSQGACSLARESMLEQINTLEHSIQDAPDNLRAVLANELQLEIQNRHAFLDTNICSDNLSRLSQFLQISDAMLVEACARLNEQSESQGIQNDIGVWQRHTDTADMSPAERDAMIGIGEDLWNFAQNEIARCNKGRGQ
jgi:hypothetical protein